MSNDNGSVSRGRGRILRIKQGYNPNSSSVGSQIPVFIGLAMATGAAGVFLMNLISAFDRRLREAGERSPSDGDGPPTVPHDKADNTTV